MTDYQITAPWETLMKQAGYTADSYLIAAIDSIDGHLGKGFAEEHPELVIGFMQVAAMDFLTASLGVAAQNILEVLRDAMRSADREEP